MRSFVALLRYFFLHAVRTRFILAFAAFGLLTQVGGVNLVANATLKWNFVVSQIGPKHALFVALFLNLLSGFFLSIVYGTWLIPSAHSGSRGELTFSWPVAKWKFPLAYFACLFGFLAVQAVLVGIIFAGVYGFSVFGNGDLPWGRAVLCFGLQAIAFSVVAFACAFGSLTLGPILTLFSGASLLFVFQVLGALMRFPMDTYFGPYFSFLHRWRPFYEWLPPFGDLVFELRRIFFLGVAGTSDYLAVVGEWGGWLVVLMGILWWRIARPPRTKPTEL